MSYLYGLLLILSLMGPLALSFDKKIAFFKNFKPLMWGTLTMMALFIPWDIFFTTHGVWGFNSMYLNGMHLSSLPIEEWSFFIVIPYACIFIVACVEGYFPSIAKWNKYVLKLFVGLSVLLFIIALFNYEKVYTLSTFLMLSVFLFVLGFIVKPTWASTFFVGYLISLIPFMIINGILTGTGIKNEVVWYNNVENLSIRVGTIPIEDFSYLMLLLVIVFWVYSEMKSLKS